jgi:hypothetical protein
MGWGKKPWDTNFNRKYQWSMPSINKSLIISLILITIIGILSYFNYTTGNYVNILEVNKTNLEDQLIACNNQTQCLTANLSTCNINLNTCNDALSGKSTSLFKCESEKNSVSDSLSTCNKDLDSCENIRGAYRIDLNSCNGDLDSCNSAKNTLRNNYAKDYCCLLNKTYYTINNNKITCTDSEGTSISC